MALLHLLFLPYGQRARLPGHLDLVSESKLAGVGPILACFQHHYRDFESSTWLWSLNGGQLAAVEYVSYRLEFRVTSALARLFGENETNVAAHLESGDLNPLGRLGLRI